MSIDRPAAVFESMANGERFRRLQTLKVRSKESALDVLLLCAELEVAARGASDDSALAYVLYRSSQAHCVLGEVAAAHDLALRASELSQRLQDRAGQHRALYELSRALAHGERLEMARDTIQRGLAIAESCADARAIADCRSMLSAILGKLGDLVQSEREAVKALSASRDIGYEGGIAMSAATLSQVMRFRGDCSGAMEVLEIALRASEASGNMTHKAVVLNSLGQCRNETGQYASALDALFDALNVAEQVGLPTYVAFCLTEIALVCANLRDVDCTIEYAQKALAVLAESDQNYMAALNGIIGEAHYCAGRFSEARAYVNQATTLMRSCGNCVEMSFALGLSGLLQIECFEFVEARKSFEAAIEAARTVGTRNELGRWLGAIGVALAHPINPHRDVAAAISYLEEGIAQLDSAKDARAWYHQELSHLYGETGYLEIARYHFEAHRVLRCELQSAAAHLRVLSIQHQRAMASLEAQRTSDHSAALAANLRATLLERDLEHKQRELASTALSLAKQTELLGKFRNDLRAIMRGNSDLLDIVKQIREKLKDLPCAAIDWAKFEADFQQTYPAFQSQLITTYPELTKMELKICSFLRMNLTSLEVAHLMCKSERSIEWHRLNIRKKLGLTREQDVYAVLAAIR